MHKFGHDGGWKIGMACASSTKEYALKRIRPYLASEAFAKYSIRADKAIQPYPKGAA